MKKLTLPVFIITLLFIVSTAFADGGFVFQGAELEAENAQQVVIMYNQPTEVERLYLSVSLSNVIESNTCWLIATPSLPIFSEESNFYLYTALKKKSDPQLYYYEWQDYDYDYYGTGCGCFLYDAYPTETTTSYYDGSTGSDNFNAVTVWYTATNADYDVMIFSSATTNIVDWLTENGYTVNSAYQSVLNDYVGRGWYFTAVRFHNAGSKNSFFAELEFDSATPVFPLYISKINSAELQRLQILFLSQHRVTTTNYNVLQVPLSNINYVNTSSTNSTVTTTTIYMPMYYPYYDYYGYWDYYEQTDAFAASNSNNVLFIEYASQVYLSTLRDDIYYWYSLTLDDLDEIIREMTFVESPLWLTRFYACISPENMRDITFQNDSDCFYQVYKYVDVYEGTTNVYYDNGYYYSTRQFFQGIAKAGGEMSLLAIPFGFIFIRRKKRK